MFAKSNLFPQPGQEGLAFEANEINLPQIYLKWDKINMQKTLKSSNNHFPAKTDNPLLF